MQRRDVLKGAGAALVGSGLVACNRQTGSSAIDSAGLPAVQWKLASSFPKSLDTIYGAGESMARRVAQLTGGKFQIKVYAAGELFPGLSVLDKVQDATVECGHTAGYYYVGKNKAFAFDTCLPFGFNSRQQNGWMYSGNGLKLMNEFLKGYNVRTFPGGNTGVQMGGWFRKEIRSLADLKGLKMRIPGFGGEILAKLGVVPQTLAGPDIYPALERGAIDATEWVGPYDDEKLGFHKVAKHYYYPGWWEGGPQLSFYVNLKKWAELPEAYRAAFEAACAEANGQMLADYDARNPPALMRLVKQGVKLHPFPADVMKAAHDIAHKLYDEEAKKNPVFAKIYSDWKKFRDHSNQWLKVAERSFAESMFTAR
jgi:TRAP-type mannitol/chloroaromatic compound transport system substrate-binding protein